jgi:hypothetical protein
MRFDPAIVAPEDRAASWHAALLPEDSARSQSGSEDVRIGFAD